MLSSLKMDARKRIIRNIIKDNVFLNIANQDARLDDFLGKSEEEYSNNTQTLFKWPNFIVNEIQSKWNAYYPEYPLEINPDEVDKKENKISTDLGKGKISMCSDTTDEVILSDSSTNDGKNSEKSDDLSSGIPKEYKQVLLSDQVHSVGHALNEQQSNIEANTPSVQNAEDILIDVEQKISPKVEKIPHVVVKETKLGVRKPEIPSSFFNLPNAKVKENYEFKFKFNNNEIIKHVDIPENIGLSCEIKNEIYCIHGIPIQAGDFVIAVVWKNNKTNKICRHLYSLIVVADPRDLWKNIPTDVTAPYQKNNEDSKLIEEDGVSIVAASKRGRSHAHKGSFRDDDFFIDHIPSGWSTLIVCDGAGSAKYSRAGSELAAKAAGEYLKLKLSNDVGDRLDNLIDKWKKNNGLESQLKMELRNLLGSSMQEAIRKIDEAARNKENVTFKDYSTTFLLAICRKQENGIFVASIGRGDGAIGVFREEINVMEKCMFIPDAGEFSGQTHFLDRGLGNDWAAIEKRIYFHLFEGSPVIFLMTDGVSDPCFGAESNLEKYEYWEKLWLEVKPYLEMPESDKALLKWLDFFVAGEHDDRTIAILR